MSLHMPKARSRRAHRAFAVVCSEYGMWKKVGDLIVGG